MKNTVKNVAVGYCRVSTDKQREESLDHQQREIEKYAEENGIKIIAWYKDHGFSGTTNNRPEFKKMIADSKKKNFSLVLVWKLDRFSRDMYMGAIAKHELKENGVKVFSVIERVDNTPEGIMIETMFEAMNQYYVGNLARGVLGGMKENVLNGLSNGSCTYGYKVVTKLDEYGNITKKRCTGGKTKTVNTYAIHPEHAAAVQLIFKMFLAGADRNKILARLKELGYKNAKGKDFIGTHIDKILRNERYTGVYTFEYNKGKQVNYMPIEVMKQDGGLPKIIEKEDFNKVQQILDARKHKPNSHSLVDYLLTGKIFCGNCGGAFTGSTHYKNGQPYFYYRCCREKSNCKMVSLRKEAVENFVLSEIEKVVHNEKYVSNILDSFVEFYKERNSNSEIIKGLETRLQDVERKITNLVGVIADSGKYTDIFQSELDTLNDEKIGLLEDIKRESNIGFTECVTKEAIRRTYFNVLKLLETGTTDDKETIINTLLNRVVVYNDRIEIFINLLPYENANAEMLITNEDLATYCLLENEENEKIAHTSDFPSDKTFGERANTRVEPKDWNMWRYFGLYNVNVHLSL